MEEPANPPAETETSTEEDMFGKPVLLGKGTYNIIHILYSAVLLLTHSRDVILL
jgi:hypothetical protein